jgi:hypothetical protein
VNERCFQEDSEQAEKIRATGMNIFIFSEPRKNLQARGVPSSCGNGSRVGMLHSIGQKKKPQIPVKKAL